MQGCNNCPIMCGADRKNGEYGVCGVGKASFVARAARHYYEEPPISGSRGSGAVFFTGCNMECAFCQNIHISRCREGVDKVGIGVDDSRLADIMLRMQSFGAHNVNLVTPTPHFTVIESAIKKAKAGGLDIPVVYNTNGYELVDVIRRLEGLVDIYLPDIKYVSPALSQKYSGRADYFSNASKALEEMFRQVGNLIMDEDGIAEKGLVVRHLVLPGAVDETRRVLDFLASEYPKELFISLMSQYTPIEGMKKPLDRRLTRAEYARAVDYAEQLGFVNVFTQELSSADSSYTPEFTGYIE